jgi:D-cysteine desulfhydrase
MQIMVQGSSLEESHDWEKILARPWLLPSVATKVKEVHVENKSNWGPDLESQGYSFHVIRDDLLHPLMGGNKLRKLDALVPLFQAHRATDVVRRPSGRNDITKLWIHISALISRQFNRT